MRLVLSNENDLMHLFSSVALKLEGLILSELMLGIIFLVTGHRLANFMADTFKPLAARWAVMCKKRP